MQRVKDFTRNELPQLIAEYNLAQDRPGVIIMSGLEGIQKIYQDILRTSNELFVFRSIYDRKNLEYEKVLKHQLRAQARKKIKTQVLISDIVNPQVFIPRDALNNVERRVIEKDFDLPAQILVYKNKTAIISLRKEVVVTVIDNGDIAQTIKTIFKTIWRLATPWHENKLKESGLSL